MITEFLTARLDELEARARAAQPEWDETDPASPQFGCASAEWQDLPDEAFAHARNLSPARVLRDVAAKRKILAEHRPVAARYIDSSYCGRCAPRQTSPCQTVRLLAAVWSDHPDYQPGWAPQ